MSSQSVAKQLASPVRYACLRPPWWSRAKSLDLPTHETLDAGPRESGIGMLIAFISTPIFFRFGTLIVFLRNTQRLVDTRTHGFGGWNGRPVPMSRHVTVRWLADVIEHIEKHSADVLVGHAVVDLLAVTLAPHHPCGSIQSGWQAVGSSRGRSPHRDAPTTSGESHRLCRSPFSDAPIRLDCAVSPDGPSGSSPALLPNSGVISIWDAVTRLKFQLP